MTLQAKRVIKARHDSVPADNMTYEKDVCAASRNNDARFQVSCYLNHYDGRTIDGAIFRYGTSAFTRNLTSSPLNATT